MIFSRNCLLSFVLTVVLFVSVVESVQIFINGQPVLVDQSLNIDLGNNASLFNITNSTDKIGSLVRFMININMFENHDIKITNNVDNRNSNNVKNNLNNNVIVNSNGTAVANNNNNAGGDYGDGGIFNNNNNFVVNGANSTNDTSIDVVVTNNNNNGGGGGGGDGDDDYYGDYYDDDYYDNYYDYPYVDVRGKNPTSPFNHASRFKTPFNYGPGGTLGGLRGNPFGKLMFRDKIKKGPTTTRRTTTTTTTTRRPGRRPSGHRHRPSSGNSGNTFRDRFNMNLGDSELRSPSFGSFNNRLRISGKK